MFYRYQYSLQIIHCTTSTVILFFAIYFLKTSNNEADRKSMCMYSYTEKAVCTSTTSTNNLFVYYLIVAFSSGPMVNIFSHQTDEGLIFQSMKGVYSKRMNISLDSTRTADCLLCAQLQYTRNQIRCFYRTAEP